MELTHIDKLLLALVLCTSCLVLENHVVVPAALHREVLLVEKRISQGNVSFPRLLLYFGSFFLL